MTKEKKTFQGKIDGVSEVTETKKEGLFRFGVKANKDWYGFSGKLKECQAEHEAALEAKDKGHVVVFTYTDDGKWLNITKVGSWNVEGGIRHEEEPASKRPPTPEPRTPDSVLEKEKKIAESHMANVEKEKEAQRERRVAHMTECLEDAEKAWTEWFFGLVVAKEDLTPEDLKNIRAIANGFMAEDGRKGRG